MSKGAFYDGVNGCKVPFLALTQLADPCLPLYHRLA